MHLFLVASLLLVGSGCWPNFYDAPVEILPLNKSRRQSLCKALRGKHHRFTKGLFGSTQPLNGPSSVKQAFWIYVGHFPAPSGCYIAFSCPLISSCVLFVDQDWQNCRLSQAHMSGAAVLITWECLGAGCPGGSVKYFSHAVCGEATSKGCPQDKWIATRDLFPFAWLISKRCYQVALTSTAHFAAQNA